jgi:hypothetical protein
MVLARWQRNIVDESGNVQSAAQMTVRRESAGAPLALLYADREGDAPLGNPFNADPNGFAAFFAPGGAYRIDVTKGAFSQTLRYEGVGLASETDALITGLAFRFDSATADSDPGIGNVRFNNTELASVTELYFANQEPDGADVTAWLDSFDNGGGLADRGTLVLQGSDAAALLLCRVTGSVIDATGYRRVSVAVLASSGSFTAGQSVSLQFSPKGLDGADGIDGLDGEDGVDGSGLFDGSEATVVARRGDLIPLQDISDADNAKRSTAQEIAETARVEIELMPFDLDTDVEVGDGAGGVFFRVPAWMNGFNVTAVAAANGTAGTGTGATTIQLRNVTQAADILSTALTIDSTETDSSTAATPAVINTAEDDLATGDIIRVDVDAITGTLAPVGLIVSITAERPTS